MHVQQRTTKIKEQQAQNCSLIETNLGPSKTILLVDDEPSIEGVAREFLERKGYWVLVAKHPAEAIQVAEQPGRIDLLLTDVVMQGTNGRQRADHLSSGRPHMKIIYMSGYTEDEIVNLGMLESDVNFIGKPFSNEVQICKVRDVFQACERK
jgi:DNA-binding NtrC family response regulator